MKRSEINERIRGIKCDIQEVKKSWPAHDTSPVLIQRLDDLEMELALAEKELEEILGGEVPDDR